MKILIMGLPGSGKTWLAERLQKRLECAWYNADAIREMASDWDFSVQGRQRQASRMKMLADFEKHHGRSVICDFVCPSIIARQIFAADYTIWMDTIKEGRFEDTNKMFEEPSRVDLRISRFISEEEVENVVKSIALHV